jgi:hypothetical protein
MSEIKSVRGYLLGLQLVPDRVQQYVLVEHDNYPLGFIKCSEVFHQLSAFWLPKKYNGQYSDLILVISM